MPRPTATGARLAEDGGIRQGDRRLHRGDPARSQVRLGYTSRGCAWESKKEYDKAIADCNEAIRLDPRDAVAYQNRGHAWFEEGRARQGHRRLTPRRSGSIRRMLRRTTTGAAPGHEGGVRQGHRRLHRGDPARSQVRLGLRPGAWPGSRRESTTRPSPTATKRSGSIPGTPRRTTTGAAPGIRRGLRQGHRRLQRGDPARPQARPGVRHPGTRLEKEG